MNFNLRSIQFGFRETDNDKNEDGFLSPRRSRQVDFDYVETKKAINDVKNYFSEEKLTNGVGIGALISFMDTLTSSRYSYKIYDENVNFNIHLVERSLDDIMSFQPYKSAMLYGHVHKKKINMMIEVTDETKLSIEDILFYNSIMYEGKTFYNIRQGIKDHRIDPCALLKESVIVTDFVKDSKTKINLFKKVDGKDVLNGAALIDTLLQEPVGRNNINNVSVLKIGANKLYFDCFRKDADELDNKFVSRSSSRKSSMVDEIVTNEYKWIKDDYSDETLKDGDPYVTENGDPSWSRQIDLNVSKQTIMTVISDVSKNLNPDDCKDIEKLKFELRLNKYNNCNEDNETIATFEVNEIELLESYYNTYGWPVSSPVDPSSSDDTTDSTSEETTDTSTTDTNSGINSGDTDSSSTNTGTNSGLDPDPNTGPNSGPNTATDISIDISIDIDADGDVDIDIDIDIDEESDGFDISLEESTNNGEVNLTKLRSSALEKLKQLSNLAKDKRRKKKTEEKPKLEIEIENTDCLLAEPSLETETFELSVPTTITISDFAESLLQEAEKPNALPELTNEPLLIPELVCKNCGSKFKPFVHHVKNVLGRKIGECEKYLDRPLVDIDMIFCTE
jgi:hypothetical protein